MSQTENLEIEASIPTVGEPVLEEAVRAKRASSISVVFPAFNEEANIELSIVAARRAMSRFFDEDKIEIIVVDDGSTDGTRKVLDRLGARYPNVKPIHHAKNKGYGAALRTGLYAARNELIFFSDSDMQFDLNEIDRLIDFITDYHIVVGYRANRADPFGRRFNAWGWNMLVWMVLGVNVRDIDCAFKLFHRDVFAKIQLSSVGAMINTELLARAAQQHLRIKEVPVSHYPRDAGQQTGANLRVIARAFRELFAMQGRLKPTRSLPPSGIEGYEVK